MGSVWKWLQRRNVPSTNSNTRPVPSLTRVDTTWPWTRSTSCKKIHTKLCRYDRNSNGYVLRTSYAHRRTRVVSTRHLLWLNYTYHSPLLSFRGLWRAMGTLLVIICRLITNWLSVVSINGHKSVCVGAGGPCLPLWMEPHYIVFYLAICLSWHKPQRGVNVWWDRRRSRGWCTELSDALILIFELSHNDSPPGQG